MKILDKFKKYFDETPREQVLKDWKATKEATKNVESPTIEQFLLYGVGSAFYCQRDIEGQNICDSQCEHCEEYYRPLEQ